MGESYKFAELRQYARKTMKFKQSKLMGLVASDDDLLTALIKAFIEMKVPREKWEKLVGDTGACAVFSAHWLAGVVRDQDPDLRMSNSSNHTLIAFQSMLRNTFLHEKISDGGFLKILITKFYKMKTTEDPIVISRLSQITELHRGMHYYIAGDCEFGTPHAVAFTTRSGGSFFDPNAGEYNFSPLPTNYRYDFRQNDDNLIKFFDKWQYIYITEFATAFNRFSCYPVGI